MSDVAVIVVAYNSRHDLEHCLPALAAQTLKHQPVVVDNDSGDGTAEWLELNHPEVTLIRSPSNLGYAGGNNLGFSRTTAALLAVLNPDTVPTPTWLERLVDAQRRHPEAGILTSSVRLHGDPNRINAAGNDVHVSGIAFCRGLGALAPAHAAETPVAAASGAAFLSTRAVLEEVHGFDPEFFTYLEDTDLSIRVRIAGHEVLYVPDSIVLHKYVNNQTPRKLYFLERNRLLLLLKDFRRPTLVALAPVMLLGELQAWTYALLRGRQYLRAKLHSYGWVLSRRSYISERRAQLRRRAPDGAVLRLMTTRLAVEQAMGESALSRAAAGAVHALYALLFLPARLLIR